MECKAIKSLSNSPECRDDIFYTCMCFSHFHKASRLSFDPVQYAARSWMLHGPASWRLQKVSRGMASPKRDTEGPNRLIVRIRCPLRGLLQYRTPLPHSLAGCKTGIQSRHCIKVSCRGAQRIIFQKMTVTQQLRSLSKQKTRGSTNHLTSCLLGRPQSICGSRQNWRQ